MLVGRRRVDCEESPHSARDAFICKCVVSMPHLPIALMVLNSFSSPDIIGRIRETGVFKNSKHGEPNHIIMNEVRVIA